MQRGDTFGCIGRDDWQVCGLHSKSTLKAKTSQPDEPLEDIHATATLKSGDSLTELKTLAQEQTQVGNLQIHTVTNVQLAEIPAIRTTSPTRLDGFQPLKTVTEIAGEFTRVHPLVNHNCVSETHHYNDSRLVLRQDKDLKLAALSKAQEMQNHLEIFREGETIC